VESGAQVGPTMHEYYLTYSAVPSSDESRILTWSGNGVHLWDAVTYAQIGSTMLHDRAVRGATFNADESRIISWSEDGTIRQWNIAWPDGHLLEIACDILPVREGRPRFELVERRYGVTISDPICAPEQLAVPIDWSTIEPMPAGQ
jgi:WD40 repeat protein